ncbi:hypothetical protein GXW82_19420 [Streptacidiphilus sp. 4-A2]|nr:hypothetical protein [Streptacidiphilus sp. 4-A2]
MARSPRSPSTRRPRARTRHHRRARGGGGAARLGLYPGPVQVDEGPDTPAALRLAQLLGYTVRRGTWSSSFRTAAAAAARCARTAAHRRGVRRLVRGDRALLRGRDRPRIRPEQARQRAEQAMRQALPQGRTPRARWCGSWRRPAGASAASGWTPRPCPARRVTARLGVQRVRRRGARGHGHGAH